MYKFSYWVLFLKNELFINISKSTVDLVGNISALFFVPYKIQLSICRFLFLAIWLVWCSGSMTPTYEYTILKVLFDCSFFILFFLTFFWFASCWAIKKKKRFHRLQAKFQQASESNQLMNSTTLASWDENLEITRFGLN